MLSATQRNALRGCARLVLFHTPHPLFITVNAQINSPFIFADHNDRGKRVVGRVAANPAGPDGRMRHTICLEMWFKRQVDRNDADE